MNLKLPFPKQTMQMLPRQTMMTHLKNQSVCHRLSEACHSYFQLLIGLPLFLHSRYLLDTTTEPNYIYMSLVQRYDWYIRCTKPNYTLFQRILGNLKLHTSTLSGLDCSSLLQDGMFWFSLDSLLATVLLMLIFTIQLWMRLWP